MAFPPAPTAVGTFVASKGLHMAPTNALLTQSVSGMCLCGLVLKSWLGCGSMHEATEDIDFASFMKRHTTFALLAFGSGGAPSTPMSGSVSDSDDEGGLSKEDRRRHHNALERYVQKRSAPIVHLYCGHWSTYAQRSCLLLYRSCLHGWKLHVQHYYTHVDALLSTASERYTHNTAQFW
jgi:hypothetical protein